MSQDRSLLVVESNLDRLDAMTRFFIRSGFQVTPVRHPRQAMEACTFKRFDAAVLSERLPEIPSAALASHLRQRSSCQKPIIVSDGETQWSEIEEDLAGDVERGAKYLDRVLERVEQTAGVVGTAS